jgi:hypothetical protein
MKIRRRIVVIAPVVVAVAGVLGVAAPGSAAPAASTTARAGHSSTVGHVALRRVGTTNLAAAAATQQRRQTVNPDGFAPSPGEHYVATDPDNGSSFTPGGAKKAKVRLNVSGPAPITTTNVAGTYGFTGVTGASQASANNGADLEPPDQGLCTDGSSVVDDVNNALQVYTTSGETLAGPVAATTFFDASPTAFFADPRCYYDAPTQRWFFTQFDVATFKGSHELTPSVQYIAVSDSSDVLGDYTVYASNSDDSSTAGCPCFGDFDQLGADTNGIYLSTNQFGDISGAFNGADIYAYSIQALEAGSGFGSPPPQAVLYRLFNDGFGQPYHVAPAETPPGGTYAANTEYFVESNSNAPKDDHLIVYALTHTDRLASGEGTPTLTNTEIGSETYAFPPDAHQPSGFVPLGRSVGEPEGKLQADFNAIQEVTYTGGKLYAEASTISAGRRDGVAYFVLDPSTARNGAVSATISAQGYVTSPGVDLLYPDIAVDSTGHGYLVMSLTGSNGGTNYFPSAAYQSFGPSGVSGPIHLAAPGALPEDGFTCYAAFVGPGYGGCRWGDYSMGVAANGRIFMGAEYIPAVERDYYSNFGTFVWSTPVGG